MCWAAFKGYRTTYACVPCRHVAQFADYSVPRCPQCTAELTHMGRNFRAPRKRNDAAWAAVASVIASGKDYTGCGCSHNARIPETAAQVRQLAFVRPWKPRRS